MNEAIQSNGDWVSKIEDQSGKQMGVFYAYLHNFQIVSADIAEVKDGKLNLHGNLSQHDKRSSPTLYKVYAADEAELIQEADNRFNNGSGSNRDKGVITQSIGNMTRYYNKKSNTTYAILTNDSKSWIGVAPYIMLVEVPIIHAIPIMEQAGKPIPKTYSDSAELIKHMGIKQTIVPTEYQGAMIHVVNKIITNEKISLNTMEQNFLDEYVQLCNKHGLMFNQDIKANKNDVRHKTMSSIMGTRKSKISVTREEIDARIEKIKIEMELEKNKPEEPIIVVPTPSRARRL